MPSLYRASCTQAIGDHWCSQCREREVLGILWTSCLQRAMLSSAGTSALLHVAPYRECNVQHRPFDRRAGNFTPAVSRSALLASPLAITLFDGNCRRHCAGIGHDLLGDNVSAMDWRACTPTYCWRPSPARLWQKRGEHLQIFCAVERRCGSMQAPRADVEHKRERLDRGGVRDVHRAVACLQQHRGATPRRDHARNTHCLQLLGIGPRQLGKLRLVGRRQLRRGCTGAEQHEWERSGEHDVV